MGINSGGNQPSGGHEASGGWLVNPHKEEKGWQRKTKLTRADHGERGGISGRFHSDFKVKWVLIKGRKEGKRLRYNCRSQFRT